MRATPALLALVLLAGCTAPAPDARDAPDEPAAAPDLQLTAPVRVTGDFLAREPAIVQLADGTLLVAGYPGSFPQGTPALPFPLNQPVDFGTTPPGLWASRNGGATWAAVEVGTPSDGAVGNSDADLAVAADGTVYLASMSFSAVGHSIALGASGDGGVTWAWRILTAQAGADRPWVEVATDGTAHAVWNDGAVVHHASSTDRGASWSEGPPVHVRGGDGGLAVGPSGEVVVRIIPTSGSGYTKHEGQDGIAVSEDGGASWTFRTIPGNRTYHVFADFFLPDPPSTFPWADPVAFDAAGTLYASWAEGGQVLLARSRDLGARWDVVVLAERDGEAQYTHLRAGPGPGELALSWFTRSGGDLTAHVARVTGADGAAPGVRAASFTPDTDGDTGGEYFQVAFLADGALGFATPVQTAAETGFEYRVAR